MISIVLTIHKIKSRINVCKCDFQIVIIRILQHNGDLATVVPSQLECLIRQLPKNTVRAVRKEKDSRKGNQYGFRRSVFAHKGGSVGPPSWQHKLWPSIRTSVQKSLQNPYLYFVLCKANESITFNFNK